jgi:hypothetical protein
MDSFFHGPRGGDAYDKHKAKNPLEAIKLECRKLFDIEVTSDLGFIRHPDGAILQFTAQDSEGMDVVTVGISKYLLREIRAAIDAEKVDWRTSGNAFCVTGTKGKVVLTVTRQSPPFGTRSITLIGDALATFRAALEELAK